MSVPKIAAVALGACGPRVGVQGLGCMGFDGNGPTVVLDAALAAGVTLFDTADVYGSGASERFLAPFLRAHRDEIVVGTKFGRVRGGAVRNDRDYLRQAVDGSLRRLGVDVVDLYYLHRRDPDIPLADSVGAMAELVIEGKVRHLGLCEVSGEELRAAHAVHPIAAVQSEWSIFAREVETSLVPAAVEMGVAVVPYSPLGRGFLTGTFTDAVTDLSADDYRRHHPRLTGDNARANADLLVPLRTIADTRGATLSQIALAWVQQRETVHGLCAVVPIPGTRRPNRIIENVEATRITLSEPELAVLEPIADRVAGERFNGTTHRPHARR